MVLAGPAATPVCCRSLLPVGATDPDTAALGHGLSGVDHQVDQYLLQPGRVHQHAAERGIELGLHRYGRSRQTAQHGLQLGDQRVQRQDLRLEELAPAEGQQLPGQVGGPLAGIPDLLDIGPDRVCRPQRLEDEIAVTQDPGEQVVEVMRDAAGEPADRFHLLRPVDLFLEAGSGGLGGLGFGHVLADVDRANDLAAFIQEWSGGAPDGLLLAVRGLDQHLFVGRELAPDGAQSAPLLGTNRLAGVRPPAPVLGHLLDSLVMAAAPELAVRGVGHHDTTLLVDHGYADLQGIEHLLELAVGLMGIGQTRLGADHPDRSPGLVAGDVGPILDHRKRAVRPAEAIFLGPDLATLGDCGIQARQDPLPIGGVNPLVPPRGGVAQLRPLVVEQGPGSFVPDEPIGYQIPIPDRLLRGLGKQAVALLTFPKGALRLLSLGDILDCRNELARLAFRAAQQ